MFEGCEVVKKFGGFEGFSFAELAHSVEEFLISSFSFEEFEVSFDIQHSIFNIRYSFFLFSCAEFTSLGWRD
jgi:hypothetical protein